MKATEIPGVDGDTDQGDAIVGGSLSVVRDAIGPGLSAGPDSGGTSPPSGDEAPAIVAGVPGEAALRDQREMRQLRDRTRAIDAALEKVNCPSSRYASVLRWCREAVWGGYVRCSRGGRPFFELDGKG